MKEYRNIQSIQELKLHAKVIEKVKGDIIRSLISEKIFPKTNPELERCFAVNHNVITFVNDGILYGIRYADEILNLLMKNGYTHKSMYIPSEI